MVIGDLFSGIGGFSLAAHWMGWRTAWFSEIDPFASRVLAHHWPDVPNLGDITRIDWANVERVNVLTAGFPCQPHSLAGKRLASSDERDLFSEIIRAVRHLRPRYVVLENVRGLLTSESGRFFGRVLRELADCGYDVEWQMLSAADVGAPHRRERIWIVADAAESRPAWRQDSGASAGDARAHGRRRVELERVGVSLGNANRGRCEQRDAGLGESDEPRTRQLPMEYPARGGRRARTELEIRRADGGGARLEHTSRAGLSRHGELGEQYDAQGRIVSGVIGDGGARCVLLAPSQWDDAVAVRGADNTVRLIPREAAESGPQSTLWPVADGIPARVAQLRGIGNSIVPQCAYEIFREIEAREVARVAA